MKIEITRWQPLRHAGAVIASFNFKINGVTVRAAMFGRKGDGYRITMPFTRHLQANGNEVTAVGLEYDDLQDVTAAALARYRDEEQNEPADAGSRRALGAEHETLERAGL